MLRLSTLLIALLASLALAAPAGAQALKSDNVELLTKLPEAAGAIGARFSDDGKTMYVTSLTGLGIYDVSDPADPQRLSRLPLPHIENEDVDVGHVGGKDIVVISNDPAFTSAGVIYIIDVTNPSAPAPLSATPTTVGVGELDEAFGFKTTTNGHIANCIQDCRYLWTTGSEEGITVYDLSDPASPQHLGSFQMPAPKFRNQCYINTQECEQVEPEPGFTHDVFVDPSGIAWITGEDGTYGYDTNSMSDPVAPRLVYRSDEDVVNSGRSGPWFAGDDASNSGPIDFLHHNSMRTSIRMNGGSGKRGKDARTAGMGNVLAVTEEDYLRPGCKGQGSLQTWQITDEQNSDGTTKLRMLDLWTTELNELRELKGRSDETFPATANCSAHWFDESDGLLAQGWYDQGVRFMDISDPTDIRQVGYWVTQGEFWGAYFAPTDPTRQIVYALDTAGGIDVLRLDRGGATVGANARTVRAPVDEADLTAPSELEASPQWSFACPLIKLAS